jgi:hypothetical protein
MEEWVTAILYDPQGNALIEQPVVVPVFADKQRRRLPPLP